MPRCGCTCFCLLLGRFLRFAVVIVASALITTQSVPTLAEDQAIESHRRDLNDVERRAQDLTQELGMRRNRRKDILAELEQRERDIADLARSGHQLTAIIGDQEQVLATLRERAKTERAALDRERSALGSLLRSLYAMGPGERVRTLLDQEDSMHMSRVLSYYDFLNRYRVRRIEGIGRRARALERMTREAAQEKERLSLLAQRQEETRARLVAAQEERAALLTSLEQTITSREEGIEELRKQASKLRALLEQLEQQARALPEADLREEPLQKQRGRLPWPLADAPLLSRYGSPKGDGSQQWDGVILKTQEGAEVRAVHAGRVVYADWLRGFGLLIIIEHEDEYMTLYGHNQTLLKEPGEWVAAGDTIALGGNSGGRASPGLYFAIRYRGRPLNPEQWCENAPMRRRKSSAAGSQRREQVAHSPLQSEEFPYVAGTAAIRPDQNS